MKITQIPKDVQFDVLSAEDRGFFTESGISFRARHCGAERPEGWRHQGGSGITEQYVKNGDLNDSRTLRKLKELAIAMKIDRDYSKDEILKWYLNTIYFGRGAYGIQAAAQAYSVRTSRS